MRKLSERGQWCVRYATHGTGKVDQYMDYLADIEANSWKLGAGSAIKLNPGLLRFIKCTAEHAAKTDRLVLSVAFLDDTPVAGVCGLVNDQRLLIYKIGYDDKFKDYSVGQHAMLGVVQYAFDHNDIKWVDSCAAPNAEMFNRCLPERQELRQYRIASRHWLACTPIVAIEKCRTIRLRLAS